ncbi:MAG: Ig-like domain-containing protein, partial [Bacillota bacterium]|nr:Ig-like domain-containing protein [Bacillota bacterium]
MTNGTVTVKATSVGTPTVEGIRVITLSNQDVIVTSIAVSSLGDTAVIDEFHGSVQMRALVLPTDAEDESVIWSVVNGTGSATISESGLLTAVSNGTVTVVATSVSYPDINGTKVMTITNQEVLVTSIVVSGAAAATTISVFRGTLQMSAVV